MKKLQGKWALVTGSSRGIGRHIAVGLAEHGCSVIVHGRSLDHVQGTVEQVRAAGVEARPAAAELSTPAGVDALIEAVQGLDFPVDILYNNAAIQGSWKEIWKTTQADWESIMQVNVYAMIALCHAFAPAMRDRGYGRIVNLSSGIRGIPNLAPYSVSKAAVDKYTIELAAELSGTNVLVSALDPGWLRTDLGGPQAPGAPESVLPGALVPALVEDHSPNGLYYSAQDYAMPV
ncbi:MAG: SDR family NAD(P)-dependent oxidoreductase [Capsulimonadaceae bacterium]